jgi:hypothetical protein
MATGRRAFTGASQASIAAAILKEEPRPMRELQPVAPPALDRLVGACLAKDPDERMQSAGDVARELSWMREGAGAPAISAGVPRRGRLAWVVAALLLGALAGTWAGRRWLPKGPVGSREISGPVTHTVIDLPANAPLALGSHIPTEGFVRSYPDGKTSHQISVDSGIEPVWCPCGELFFRKGNQWLSARILSSHPELRWDPPRPAFQTDFIDTPGRSYDVSPDGQRLIVVKRAAPEIQTKLHLITNWYEPQRP